MRLKGDALTSAAEMLKADGKKSKIKMMITEKTGKPILLKNLHNLQTRMQMQKQAGPEDGLQKLFAVLSEVPNSTSCFVTDENDELVGNLCRIIRFFLCVK